MMACVMMAGPTPVTQYAIAEQTALTAATEQKLSVKQVQAPQAVVLQVREEALRAVPAVGLPAPAQAVQVREEAHQVQVQEVRSQVPT